MTKPVTKAGRLLLLYRLREEGVLDGMTLQVIGDTLGVNRSTVLRDLRDLEQAESEFHRLAATLPWGPPPLTVQEFARAIGAQPDTVRAMIRDGLVTAHKRPERGQGGRWYIPPGEVERFKGG